MTSSERLDLSFCVPGLAFNGATLDHGSLGGSETAGLLMARELARLGHHVEMFCTLPDGTGPDVFDGVRYHDLTAWPGYARQAPHDVAIVQRAPHLFGTRLNTRLNVLWCHDLALGRTAGTVRSAMWNVDLVAVLSQFMRAQYQEVYRLPDAALWTTRNGIDVARVQRAGQPPRNRKVLLYGARPERGLDVMLDWIFPALLEQDPDLRLHIATYSIKAEPGLAALYARIEQYIARNADRVTFLGALKKDDWYRALATAGVYVYPTPSPSAPQFREISCINAMEAQAAGLPIVTSANGALPETIGAGAGVLVDGQPASVEYRDQFVEAVLRYVRDDATWAAASAAGRAYAPALDWAHVAAEWAETFTRAIEARNTSPRRLVQHFIRRSDIQAARSVLDTMPTDDCADLRARLDESWGFADSGDGLKEQYEKVGQTHTDVFAQVPQELRFRYLAQWLKERPAVERILDYGCAHGSYTVHLANAVGRTWLGLDIDQHSIRWAEFNRRERAIAPDTIEFRVGTHETDLSDQAPFDLLVAFEVLEHVPDPTAVIEGLERWIGPGGRVLITVPYGPWEWLSYESYPHRCHLWEFDLHDLRDLFGQKSELQIAGMPAGQCEPLQEPLGWYVVEYRVDGAPTGRIDMARKRRLQRPRETVAAVMIAGPDSESMLRWALEPARAIVDEIIIGDCGMSKDARAIAESFGAVIVPAADPLVDGFETPRNQALAYVRSDWVAWWDSDERPVGIAGLNKYLRANMFAGYNIKQHNFSCNAPHDPTIPVRCFRRERADGQRPRWFGLIHEQPEVAINDGIGEWLALPDVHVAHLGYISGDQQVQRFWRNWPLLLRDVERYPDRHLNKHFMCRDLVTRAVWALQANGGVMTPEVEQWCHEIVRLYRAHFLGKPNFINQDTLPYYSRALEMLGQGIEIVFACDLADGDDKVALERARFASPEEAKQEVAWRLERAMQRRLSEWW